MTFFAKISREFARICFLAFCCLFVYSNVLAKLIFITEENAVNTNNFIINADDSSSNFVDLEFGSALGVKMSYEILSNKFVINRDLEVDGSGTFFKNLFVGDSEIIHSEKVYNDTFLGEDLIWNLLQTKKTDDPNDKDFPTITSGNGWKENFPITRWKVGDEGSLGQHYGYIGYLPNLNKEFRVNTGGSDKTDLVLGAQAKDVVHIKSDDFQVGIGTDDPKEQLHINDNLRLNGSFADKDGDYGISGQVLSSTVTGTDWIANSANPIPFISTTIKKKIPISYTSVITINGELFTPTSTVTIPGFDGTINNVNVISSSEIEITLTPGTTQTIYDIIVSNSGVLNTAWSGNGQNLIETKNIVILVPGDGTTNWVKIQTAATSLGKLVPTTTGSGWSKGAGFGVVPAGKDFLLTFNPSYMTGQSAGGYAMIGMDNSDPNWNYNTIDYAVYMQNGSNYYVYENGSSKGNHDSWTTSDLLGIRRTGTTIEYLKNGTVVYTSATASSGAMYFDSSLYRYLGAENIQLEHDN